MLFSTNNSDLKLVSDNKTSQSTIKKWQAENYKTNNNS